MSRDKQIRIVDCRDLVGTITKNTYVEQIIDVSTLMTVPKASFMLKFTGSGTVKIEQFVTNEDDPANWVEDGGGDVAAAGVTAGTYMYDLTPAVVTKWMKIKITEGNTADAVVAVAMAAFL